MPNRATQLARVYARWRSVFLRGLWRHHRHTAQAEDAFHDAVVRCLAAPAVLATEDETRAYLHQIVRHGSADEARESLAGRRLQTVPFDEADTELAGAATPADAGPFQAVARRQRIERLNAALAEMPERQREAFVLHRFDGLTQDEVARRMGISRRMVVKHLSRALAYCQVRVEYATVEQMQDRHRPAPSSASGAASPAPTSPASVAAISTTADATSGADPAR